MVITTFTLSLLLLLLGIHVVILTDHVTVLFQEFELLIAFLKSPTNNPFTIATVTSIWTVPTPREMIIATFSSIFLLFSYFSFFFLSSASINLYFHPLIPWQIPKFDGNNAFAWNAGIHSIFFECFKTIQEAKEEKVSRWVL